VTHHATRLGKRHAVLVLGVLAATSVAGTTTAAPPDRAIELEVLGTYASGIFAGGGAEIVRYDERTKRVFAVNAGVASVDVLDVSDPTAPSKVAGIDVAATLAGDPAFTGTVAGANSVAVHGGVLAVAVEASPKTDTGWAAFYRTDSLELLGWVEAGALPDMITFSPDGRMALVANEGEPNGYGLATSLDPEGSVTVVGITGDFRKLTSRTVRFTEFNGREDALRATGVRIFGPGSSAAQDFEPEYIAVSPDNLKAYVTLQENNAIAVLDLKELRFTRVLPLGFKDHSAARNGFDGSDRDGPGNSGKVRIAPWPVLGMYMPDGISLYRAKGKDYLVTANEGDSRQDWLAEEARVKDLALDPVAFPNATDLKNDDFIGRLTVTTTLGDADGDGKFEKLYAFGGRSFSIWDEDGKQVFDSGDAFEQITAEAFPQFFNSDHEVHNFDNRSDNKGPEPEGLAIGEIRGRTYAFVGLERIGGVMVYDITDPKQSAFVTYVNNRDFAGSPTGGTAGDLGPEGLEFIPADRSPTGEPMLAVGNEVSGTTTLYAIRIVR
jgi:2',3'-cyclic-nucleotide 2'-phosphodiesterase/3'-nucleotidase/5'-nucleotidase